MFAYLIKLRTIVSLVLIVLMNLLPAQVGDDEQTISAIRVEFVEDNNPLTTGNGKFMIDTVTVDSFAIDPAPHDKPYFEDQIEAVSNYFINVSQGQLSFKGRVYPAVRDSAYQLPNQMGYYNPNTTDDEVNLGLSHLFVDAVTAADKDGSLRINDHDILVIFHAGVGKDVALGYDETPQDIPSLFITLDFLRKYLGSDFEGVPVKDGIVTQGILLPETENQQGYQIALTGIFASNVGSYLGLFDLFSPTEQRSGIGRFGIMDFGLMNLNGLVPSAPCAFSRQKIGWVEPVILDKSQTNIKLDKYTGHASASDTTLYRIPINNNEYYLIENRGDAGVNIDSEYVELINGRDEAPTYLELLKIYHPEKIRMSENGVLLSVSDYDLGIGGAGILIWHIDESVIANGGDGNAVNDDPDHRAVDLEEADGSQDIGHIYGLLDAGFQKDLGWFADFWYSNRHPNLKDFELYQNKFSAQTRPNSNSNLNRSNSHITLHNFSGNQSDIMTFDFQRGQLENGYPLSLYKDDSQTQSMVYGSVSGGNMNYLFIANDHGEIYAVSDSGSGLLYEDRRLISRMEGVQVPEQISIALADTNSDKHYDVLVAVTDKHIYAWYLDRPRADSLATPVFLRVEVPAIIITPPVTRNDRILVGCSDGVVYECDLLGNLQDAGAHSQNSSDLVLSGAGAIIPLPSGTQFASIAPGLNQDDMNLTWNSGDHGFRIGKSDGADYEWNNFPTADMPQGPFSVADIDGNGTYDMLFNGADNVYAYNQDGTLISGFPIKPVLASGDNLIGTPLVLDINDDGMIDVVTATRMGQILAIPILGALSSGFPLSTGGGVSQTPVIGNFDQDENLELAAVTSDGILYMWEMAAPETSDMLFWLQARKSAANNKLIEMQISYQPVGSGLMPANRVFNYPNPNKESFTTIRYYLNDNANVDIKIYDTAGTLIKELSGPGQGKTDNEVRWDLSNVASGVYLCRVEAKSQNSGNSKIIKIMVVH